MDETKKHLYRIDSLKVQQKIFDMYPADSDARKLIIKEQKIQEYQKLSRTLSSFPVAITKETLRNSKKIIGFAALRALGGLVFTYFISTLLGPSLSVGQAITVIVLGGAGLVFALATIAQIFITLYSMKLFHDSLKGIEDRLSKLKKDIF